MKSQRFPMWTLVLVAAVVSLALTLPCMGHGGGGHGGGAGHALGGYGGFHGGPYGFRGGYGHGFYGYRGFWGYPFLGLGLGMGLGYGLGYGMGYGYGYGLGGYGYGLGGYNYPPYYPYAGGYPGYGAPVYTPPPPPAPYPTAGQAAPYPAAGQGPVPATPTSAAQGTLMRLTDSDMILSIRVPPDAVVRINGEKTNQNGPRREFMSSGLSPGRTYTFVVSAQWTAPNGQAVQSEQRLHVQGGERRNVDFLMPPSSAPDVH
jgi:uncharacterized protein (TIGR03000 family)